MQQHASDETRDTGLLLRNIARIGICTQQSDFSFFERLFPPSVSSAECSSSEIFAEQSILTVKELRRFHKRAKPHETHVARKPWARIQLIRHWLYIGVSKNQGPEDGDALSSGTPKKGIPYFENSIKYSTRQKIAT